MTREELKEHCKRQIQQFERVEKIMPVTPNDWKRYEEHKLILELLEQESRWIPCSERLPEDSGEYFVTVIDEDVETYKHTGIAWYAHPKDYDVEEGDWRELMIDEKVIAWMPLPAPFEPQESEG